MKTIKLLCAAGLLALPLSSPLHAQSVGEKTGVNSLIGVAPSTQDFITQAVIGGLFEVETSKLAVEKASEPTKAFAQKMVADHEKASGELKALIQSADIKAEVPTALDSSHQSKLDTLKGLSGEDFVKQYHDDQVSAHKNAVDLFKRYGEGGDNAQLKQWAASTKPHLDEHLKMAQDLDAKK